MEKIVKLVKFELKLLKNSLANFFLSVLKDKCQDYCSNNSTCKIVDNQPKCICGSGNFGSKCEK